MSVRSLWSRRWARQALAIVLVLVVLAPAFAWAAGAVGYTEPLEKAAEDTGATDDANPTTTGPLADYTAPGLPMPVGTLLSGLIGSGVVLALGLGVGRLLDSESPEQ